MVIIEKQGQRISRKTNFSLFLFPINPSIFKLAYEDYGSDPVSSFPSRTNSFEEEGGGGVKNAVALWEGRGK